jgi:CheY-like chemotaxis protein
VVDDSPELRDFVELLLADAGYAVVTAASLVEAERALAPHRPDLVVADVRLPDAAPFAVLDLLTADAQTRSLPVLLCTGAVQEVEAAAARLAQANVAVMTKPFDIADFLTVAQRLCPLPVPVLV